MKKSVQNLVVGLDLSSYSKLVAKEAQELSKALQLPITYVYAYEDSDLYHISIVTDRKSVARIYENKIRKNYNLNPKDKVLIRFGLAEKEILSVARKLRNPLILVGYRSGHAITRFFLGSVAERLALTSPFPIWIHRGEKLVLPEKILIPSDLSERSDKTLKEIKPIENALGASIEVYHVQQNPFPISGYEAWAEIQKRITKSDIQRLKTFKKKHPGLKIIREKGAIVPTIQSRAKNFDLIAISPRHPRTKGVFGKVTGRVVRSADRPVLVVP